MSTDRRERSQSPAGDRFYNPYTFIPTPPRDKVTGWAGDADPLAAGLRHDRLGENLWTGTIRVKMTVRTPLLLMAENPTCDHDCKPCGDSTHHKIYDVREDIPLSSIRGMLRSAYEAITNSRYGVFKTPRQAYRPPANEAADLVPLRILEVREDGSARAEILMGTRTAGGKDQASPLAAAWVPCKQGGRYVGPQWWPPVEGSTPQHGQRMYARCALVERRREGRRRFRHWQVIGLAQNEADLDSIDLPDRLRELKIAVHRSSDGDLPLNGAVFSTTFPNPLMDVEGFLWSSGNTFLGKHDERFFFSEKPDDQETIELPRKIVDAYNELIRDYRDRYNEQKDQRGEAPDCHRAARVNETLKPGTHGQLLFGDVQWTGTQNHSRFTIKELRPVHISRRIYPLAPAGLIMGTGLEQAIALDQLSPADRLFGWVGQSRQDQQDAVAYAGRIRLSRLRVAPPAGRASHIRRLDKDGAMPLAILGAPKPAQGRFYVAKSPAGESQSDGLPKEAAGYDRKKGLRGRKQYWPHRRSQWHLVEAGHTGPDIPGLAPKVDGARLRSGQNRSIRGWIEPGTTVSFDLELTNASAEEVGALLWLLDPNQGDTALPQFQHRLGYGKPLGFGCVTLAEESVELATTAEWKTYWSDLSSEAQPAGLDESTRGKCIDAFKNALSQGDVANFAEIPYIKAFLAVGRGPAGNHPVKYPHIADSPGSEQYRWFVENDRGPKYSLPDATDPNGTLPVL